MKRIVFSIVLFAPLVASFALLANSDANSNPNKDKKEWMKDQTDQTDTLAIPLDSSEAEEQEEEESLMGTKKKAPSTSPENKDKVTPQVGK